MNVDATAWLIEVTEIYTVQYLYALGLDLFHGRLLIWLTHLLPLSDIEVNKI